MIPTGDTAYIIPTKDGMQTVWTNWDFAVWWDKYYKKENFPKQLSVGIKRAYEEERIRKTILMLVLDRKYIGDKR